MTRRRTQTVDYFPHNCNHGETIFILEQRFGNDGYAFWFKLLELLGKTEGHTLDCRKLTTLNYLAAKTLVSKEKAEEILNLLAEVEAIDLQLWTENKMIWSDNFIKGLAFAYRNRETPIPVKPVIYTQESGISRITTSRNPQRKVKERKGKEIKDNATSGPVGPSVALNFFSCQFFEVDFDYRMKLAKEYPALNDDLLKAEFSKMEDWIIDNKGKKKFKSNGHLGNPRLFIKNWLNRVTVDGQQLFAGENKPKGYAGLKKWAEGRKVDA